MSRSPAAATFCSVLFASALAACASPPQPRHTATAVAVPVPEVAHPDGETAEWWFRLGASQAAARGGGGSEARNLILFVGDGMSLPTVAAARILAGQRAGQPGEGTLLAWERFGHTPRSAVPTTPTRRRPIRRARCRRWRPG